MTSQAYVHHASKTLVFWTYKGACTSLVHALAYDLFEMPMDDVDPRIKLDPMLVPCTDAVDLTLNGYRSIGLIRDPWERLVSAYLHILVNRDGVPIRTADDLEGSGRRGHAAISGGAQEFSGVTFRSFIEHCLTGIEQRNPEPDLDPHWNTQIPFFFLEREFQYDHLFPLARMSEFYATLSELVGKPVSERRVNVHHREARRAMNLVDTNSLEYCDDSSLRHIQNFEDARLRGAVEQAYKPDYHYYSPLVSTSPALFRLAGGGRG